MMNKKQYIRPALRVIEFREDLMQTLPVGNSRDWTDSSDERPSRRCGSE